MFHAVFKKTVYVSKQQHLHIAAVMFAISVVWVDYLLRGGLDGAKARGWQTCLCFHKRPVSTYFTTCQPYGLYLCCCAVTGIDSM